MPTVTIPFTEGIVINNQKSVTLTDELGNVQTLPIVAPTTQWGELAPTWTQVPRPGLVQPAYNVKGPRPLHSITLQVTVVDTSDVSAPVDDLLNQITMFLQNANAIRLAYASFDSLITANGTWVCTSWQPQAVMRDEDTNSPIVVQGNLVLTESNPQPFAVVPGTATTTNGKTSSITSPVAATVQASSLNTGYPPKNYAATPSNTAQQAAKVMAASQATNKSSAVGVLPAPGPSRIGTKYTVKAHDTLHSISMQAYGTLSGWLVIAQANHLPNSTSSLNDPRLLMQGQVLTIPSGTPAKTTAANPATYSSIYGNLTIPNTPNTSIGYGVGFL